MKKSINFLENKKIKSRKRENQRKFNYIDNYKILDKIEFEEIKNRYNDYLDDFKDSSMKKNREYEIYLFQFDDMNIIIRDDIEKSFFFNKFINEYLEEKKKDEKLSFKKFIIDISNFLIFKDYKYIILDIESDYLKK